MITITTTTQPSTEVITLDELKAYVRGDDADDARFELLRVSSRKVVEQYIAKSLITQTHRLTIDRLDIRSVMTLWKSPIQSITSITIYDQDNQAQIYDSSNYFLHDDRLIFKQNAQFDFALRVDASMEVLYDAGYGDNPEDVPAPVRQAILDYAKFIYECNANAQVTLPDAVRQLLSPYRSNTIFFR